MIVKLTAFVAGVLAGAAIVFTVMSYTAGVLEARTVEINHLAPESWGTVKGGSGSYVIFEDAAGTLRIYEPSTGRVVSTVARKPDMPR